MKLRRILSAFLMGIILFINISGTSAVAAGWPSGPKPGSLSCDSAIVMEVSTGTILYKKNIHKQHYPASITKIMTALVALENSSLSDIVTFSSEAVYGIEQGSSTIYSEVGEKMTMEQCLYAIMLESANEVCLAIGEHIAGNSDEFVDMMNDKAAELGLKDTHFNNPNGLPDTRHYTTAYDMAVIAREAIQNSTFRKITGTKSYLCAKTNKHKNIRGWLNHHQMLNGYEHPKYEYKYCTGGKTGYTQAAHSTLVTYAEKNGMQLLSVIMYADGPKQGEPNEYTDTTSLLDFGFGKYKKYNVNEEKTYIDSSLFNTYNNFFNTENSPIRLSNESAVVLPEGVGLSKAKQKITYDENVDIKDGENIIGTVTYTYKGRVAGYTDIIYEKKDQIHLDEASRKIISNEIKDIEDSSAKAASKHKRIAKIKSAVVNFFLPVINFIKRHIVITYAVTGVLLAAFILFFLLRRLRSSDGRLHRSSGGYRSRTGRRRHAKMERRAARRQVPAKRTRRNNSKHYQQKTPQKNNSARRKKNAGYSRRRRNTRESFGKNFFDF